MSSMLDYHTPHLSLPAQGHGEGGDQVFIAFWGVSWLVLLPVLLLAPP
jgi:hypothetical protein